MTVGNTPATSGQSEYQSKQRQVLDCSKVIQVPQDAGNSGFHASFAATDDYVKRMEVLVGGTDANLLGVLNGFFYIDETENLHLLTM